MRLLFFIFILALCFILGVQYGLDRQGNDLTLPVSFESNMEEKSNEPSIEHEIETNQTDIKNTTTTYKAANALASLVDLIYEIIVHILYQISKLFY